MLCLCRKNPCLYSLPLPVDVTEPVVEVLRRYGCLTLFHFTDASNVESIRKHGLLSASSITKQEIVSTMNSDDLSRTLDQACGLQDYVRLSFNANNPMRFVAVKEKRISKPVIVVIKLEVVSRSGVLFSDCNATRKEAVISPRPEVVRFDVVKASNQFQVKHSLRHLYQAEVLVPSPLPPEFIVDFRKIRADKRVVPAAASRVITAARAPCSNPPVALQEKAPSLPPDPVAVGRVATDGASSDALEEASDTSKRLPQVELDAPPALTVVDTAAPAQDDPPKVFVLEPTPHGKDFLCGGHWMCRCGETECPHIESGYSPKKEEPPPVFNQWCPDLTMNGSSSTDCARTKVTYVSRRESGARDASLVENRKRTNLLQTMLSSIQSASTTSSLSTFS